MNGIQYLPTTVSGTAYTVLTSDLVLACNPTSNAIAITMYNNPPDGATVTIFDETNQAATHNITITPGTQPTSAKVDNTTSLVLNINGESVTLTYHLSTNNWMAAPTRASTGITAGSYSARPGSPTQGQMYYATDLSPQGIMIVYSGSIWKPLGGVACLDQNGTTLSSAGSGATEFNLYNKKIPGGLLSNNGALRITANGSFALTNGIKTMLWRLGTASGQTSGGYLIVNSVNGGTNTALSAVSVKDVWNCGTTNVQIIGNVATQTSYGGASSGAETIGSVDTTTDFWVCLNYTGNALDTLSYRGIRIEWIEQ